MSGVDGRILDKQNYSSETLSTYGYLSAYFIDMFYNDLYDQGIRYHRQKSVNTITDGYKCSLDAMLQGINKRNAELYRDIVNGLYQYFLSYGFTGLSYQNCIDKIVKEFIPQDYWKVLSFDDKSKILGTVITNSLREMIHKIVSSHLHDVIDNHDEPGNAELWQDEFIDILIIEREKLYQSIVNVKTGNSGENTLVNAMKKEIKLLYTEKTALQQKIIELKKNNLDLNKLALAKHKLLKDSLKKYRELKLQFETSKTSADNSNAERSTDCSADNSNAERSTDYSADNSNAANNTNYSADNSNAEDIADHSTDYTNLEDIAEDTISHKHLTLDDDDDDLYSLE